MSRFPTYRARRMRRTERLRALVRETVLQPHDFIAPLFVTYREGRHPVEAMPGVEQLSVEAAAEEAARLEAMGVGGVLLFGIPATKDAEGSGAYAADGVVQRAVSAIKERVRDLLVITDVCMCEYTDHGHCGVLTARGEVDNDATLELLSRSAVSHAEAGADMVAPSDMMDGRVSAIRQVLDGSGFSQVPIMSYAVKYASAFYGPFREAAESAPQFGDRRGYQMDPANSDEGLREALSDIDEGADILMVKPAVPYLDVIQRVKQETGYPVAAYHVSGEYSMIKAAAERGWIDEERVMLETMLAIRRAGADVIITYYAARLAETFGG
ncbi:MAG: porphobilinogen synthase [Gemmatimonadota bacterium]|nr:MAG: porphobilinogen synthase [Gemmatimonadota bacterium]